MTQRGSRPSHSKPVCIWTRSRSDLHGDRALFAPAWRRRILFWPCTAQVPLPIPQRTLARLATLTKPDTPFVVVCTSPKAATIALAQAPLKRHLMGAQAWWTFGMTTARLLRARGFTVKRPRGCDTAAQLFDAMQARLPRNTTIVILQAEEPAFNTTAAWRKTGRPTLPLVIYRTEQRLTDSRGKTIPASRIRSLIHRPWIVALASPSAVKSFTRALGAKTRTWPAITAVCIGETTQKAAAGQFDQIKRAQVATIAGLARALQAVLS